MNELDGLGPLPVEHPREPVVRAAEHRLRVAFEEALADLTTAEKLRTLNNVTSEWIASLARVWIRQDRHGDIDKPDGTA